MKRYEAIGLVIFCGIVVVIYLGYQPTPNPHSITSARQADLRSVATIIFNYAEDHKGVLPDPNNWYEVMQIMYPELVYPEPTFGEDSQDNIWMCPIPWENQLIPETTSASKLAKIPMIHEKASLDPERTSVVFWDGSVRWLSNSEFEQLINIEDSICLGCQLLMKNSAP